MKLERKISCRLSFLFRLQGGRKAPSKANVPHRSHLSASQDTPGQPPIQNRLWGIVLFMSLAPFPLILHATHWLWWPRKVPSFGNRSVYQRKAIAVLILGEWMSPSWIIISFSRMKTTRKEILMKPSLGRHLKPMSGSVWEARAQEVSWLGNAWLESPVTARLRNPGSCAGG